MSHSKELPEIHELPEQPLALGTWLAQMLRAPSRSVLNSMWRTAAPALRTAIGKKLHFND